MFNIRPDRLARLEPFSPIGFILAGLLLIVYFITFSGEVFTPAIRFMFFVGSWIFLFLALIGFFALLRTQAPTYSLVGGIAAIVSFAGLGGEVVPTILAVLNGVPFGEYDPSWSQLAFSVFYFSGAISLFSYGFGSFRTRTPSRNIGVLLILGSVLLGYFGVVNQYNPLPDWVLFADFVGLYLVLIFVGAAILVNKATDWKGEVDPSAEFEAEGWTNGYVRDGFNVDGTESRASPFSMETRISWQEFVYDAVGDGHRKLRIIVYRSFYPVIRWVGTRTGRETSAEQYIAENEFITEHLRGYEREPWTSKRGFVARMLVVGCLVGGFILGYLFASITL